MAAQWKHCQRSMCAGTPHRSLCFIAFFHIRHLCFYRLLSLALFPHLSQINTGELCSGNTNAQGDARHLQRNQICPEKSCAGFLSFSLCCVFVCLRSPSWKHHRLFFSSKTEGLPISKLISHYNLCFLNFLLSLRCIKPVRCISSRSV